MANGIDFDKDIGNGMTLRKVEQYVKDIIPKIEEKLSEETDKEKLFGLLKLYKDTLRLIAPFDFISYNKYLEFEEDKRLPTKGFYHHRKNHMGDVFEALNDMEIYDKYDMLLLSTAPRTGKSTIGIRFLSWVIGRHPIETQLGTSYSDNITQSFYNGVMEIIESEIFGEVFPNSLLVNQNAKRQEIWLREIKRYPSISFVSIGGSMTGRSEASKYLYCDDLVSGIEEALSIPRLDKLWQLYTVNAMQRKKDGAKEIHIATQWSVHDPITKLIFENEDNPRCKIIAKPCYDEFGNSQFDFFGGFSTKYYDDLKHSMDSASFDALYMCTPVEREGLLYHEEELQYYLELPSEKPDSIIAVCDSKNLGKDYVASPIGYVYGDLIYLEDVVYNNGLPEVTRPAIARKWFEHKVVRGDVELNNGGNYFAEGVDDLIKKYGGNTSIRLFFTGNNKMTKIVTYSDFVKKHFVFKDSSKYAPNSQYDNFMKDVFRFSQSGKNKTDDACDSLAMLAQLYQDLNGNSVKILDRKVLKI